MKAKYGLIMILCGLLLASGCRGSRTSTVVWNTYEGKTSLYHITVGESMNNNGRWHKEVHLEAVDNLKDSKTVPFAMTGHDWDGDGQFDEVFIREYYSNGYNAVVFTGTGERKWNPCGADKDDAQPPTDVQLAKVQSQLYLAMADFYNKEHLATTIDDYRKN